MLPTRSARLAAGLLLALLLGWGARAYRLRHSATAAPLPAAAPVETAGKFPKNSFPDE